MTYVGEGFATMATVHDASERPSIAAGDADNLLKVAKALREVPSHKKAPFVICADSDAWTGHPGEQKGIEAAIAIGAPMAVPVFAEASRVRANRFQRLVHRGRPRRRSQYPLLRRG